MLTRGQKVRAVVRNAEKAADLAKQGADVQVADLADREALARALSGARGAYVLSPPNLQVPDFLAHAKRNVDNIAAALRDAQVEHAVLLSSVGAELASGTGPIRTLHYAEGVLKDAVPRLSRLRPAYFQENWLSVAQAVKQDGVLPVMFGPAERAIPMVATADIGRVAAEALLAPPEDETIELAGPEDYSPNDVARIFGKRVGRDVQVAIVPFESQIATFQQFGCSESVAELFKEMHVGITEGKIQFKGEPQRGRIGLEQTLKSHL